MNHAAQDVPVFFTDSLGLLDLVVDGFPGVGVNAKRDKAGKLAGVGSIAVIAHCPFCL